MTLASGCNSFLALQLLSPSNVAVYGGLCALATFDRQELQRNVISSRCVRGGCWSRSLSLWGAHSLVLRLPGPALPLPSLPLPEA